MAVATQTIGGEELEVTVLMPCLNEESAIPTCVREAMQALDAAEIVGEVLVVDNGSIDRSAELAREAGARVVYEPQKGYGNAYLRGFKEARGRYVVIEDSDGTYDFSLVPQFLEHLRNGCEFVNGSRTKGDISPGSMPFLHRYVGVPILSWLLNRLTGAKFSDAHCGMRGFIREAVEKMELRTSGMELASEMILQAARANIRTAELPISYRARKGESKLHTFSDGWRHLRFMLLYSPTHLFALPGVASRYLG
jgi:glycosyltransferase involved in cell wall biosynthesis